LIRGSLNWRIDLPTNNCFWALYEPDERGRDIRLPDAKD
jgi:hypothetical protein